jgi:hypothetical protein
MKIRLCGRHRCLLACKPPFAVSFDDDSYPVDSDFFRNSRAIPVVDDSRQQKSKRLAPY